MNKFLYEVYAWDAVGQSLLVALERLDGREVHHGS